ncbi:MAG TPA: beta-phosphoglucomutase [Firmicutes bacterium]|nr:beta-phosphoglucomutase [Bacillota bacterium]
MAIKAVIFDLDGVVVSTDEYHYRAWAKLAAEEGIYFDREINERLRGVSRLACLEIILERAKRSYTQREKERLAARKNSYYRSLLADLSPADILPGVLDLLAKLKDLGYKTAIGSASKNAPLILAKIELSESFDAVVDGNSITKSKPDPQVFLLAAELLEVEPAACVVIEDAKAGIDAALAAGMRAVGVGSAANYAKAHLRAENLAALDFEELMRRR